MQMMKKMMKKVMKKKLRSIWVLSFVLAALLYSGTYLGAAIPAQIKKLDVQYQQWYEQVYWIITQTEKDIFLKLPNNRDRDSFIDLFWKMRDPTNGTPENEYKTEHFKRFNFANKYFKYGSPLPGWQTDRGRIHILLGPAVSANEVFTNGLYPVLIWEYYGSPSQGLPTVFRVVFYKPYGSGDYQLYIPAVDGPAALLRAEIGSVNSTDYYDIYTRIHELEPAVAEISLSLIPGENLYEYAPSLQCPILMSKIYDLPKRKINTTYAKNFLNYKGLVETSVMTNYINLSSELYIIKDPLLDINFVHFAILPERISVDYSPDQNKYYFNYNLMVILKKEEEVIFQYNKDYPFYYTKEELDNTLSHGIIITDYFPVIEGEYKLIAILQNSVNKELSYYEKDIKSVPVHAPGAKINGPFISYEHNPLKQMVYSAFNLVGQVIKIDPKRTFSMRDSIYAYFCIDRPNPEETIKIEMEVLCEDEARPYQKIYPFQMLPDKKFEIFYSRLEKLNYGNYFMKIRILDSKNQVVAEEVKDFVVSPLSDIPHPPSASKTMQHSNRFFFYTIVANQYENMANTQQAEIYYEKAFALNQTHPELIKYYANLLLQLNKNDRMLDVIEGLKGQEKEKFNYFSLRGRALYQKARYQEAVDALIEANKIFDSDTTVLNTLGLAFIRLDNKGEAIKALSASLKINDGQDTIAQVLTRLKAEKTEKTDTGENKPKKPAQEKK